ncbi:MAG: tRNA preQ1(34) S-adenosylmethionine ribosyltransferase-isomerase QueA [bacterium]|nr:tRNA preQ1(34) S-adenosylmethionine ribosyltransferase-isomerase QueA [bacterium]
MKLSEFDYELPKSAIARYPAARREDARLLVLPRGGGEMAHARIRDLGAYLRAGDLLVVNDTKVRPWRMFGKRPTGGKVEALFLRPGDVSGTLIAMVSANRPLKAGERILFPGGMEGTLGPPGEERAISFPGQSHAALFEWLDASGEVPLPPYLERRPEPLDAKRYQTVYARSPGAIAAPTAGLHLTHDLLKKLEAAGIRWASLTLHVGPGTFRPVKSEQIEDHKMDAECYEIPPETAEVIEGARRSGGRIIAVGTTVVRALESAAMAAEGGENLLSAGPAESRLFIRPGHDFRVIDGLLTNFHLPRSTLLMLVAAFAGKERILGAYGLAREKGYRFYSYGDAMLLV